MRKSRVIRLPIERAIYVPSTKDVDKRISRAAMSRRVAQVRRMLSKQCGGYTSVRAMGGYITSKNRIVKEPVIKVTSFCSKDDAKKSERAFRIEAPDFYLRTLSWC